MKKGFAILLFITMLLSCTCAFAQEVRAVSEQYAFELAEGDQLYFENLIFDGDVTVSGDNAKIIFANCFFIGDVILTADEATQVMLLGCGITGRCMQQNAVTEATLDWAFPKFLVDSPVEVVSDNCIGSVIALGDFEVLFNGKTYSMADSQLYIDTTNSEVSIVPYEGQPASYYCIVQWWENDEPITTILSELEA